jgi:DNA-directed RNA polymerase specialized sigma54-like protein
MPEERYGFLVESLAELQERLKAEIARNPFLRREDDRKEKDAPPPDPGAPG